MITDTGHALFVDAGVNATLIETCDFIPIPKNANWMAPELFVWDEAEQVEIEGTRTCTSMSDVFSFGRTMEEVAFSPAWTMSISSDSPSQIYTLSTPFSQIHARNRMHFIVKLRSLILAPPPQPFGMPLEMWRLMELCLAQSPKDRPSARLLHQTLL